MRKRKQKRKGHPVESQPILSIYNQMTSSLIEKKPHAQSSTAISKPSAFMEIPHFLGSEEAINTPTPTDLFRRLQQNIFSLSLSTLSIGFHKTYPTAILILLI